MPRKVTLVCGQWADLPIEELCKKAASFGYDGLELATWNGHLDILEAAKSQTYCADFKKILARHGLSAWTFSAHLQGQLTCDLNDDARSDGFCADKSCWGDPEKKRRWGIEQLMAAPAAARNMGMDIVTGFMGSPIWHMVYSFPPASQEMIDNGFRRVKEIWTPILAEFKKHRVRFCLEVHPTEIAFDTWSAERLLQEFDYDKTLGFNFDPSHLLWQGIDPARFLRRFIDRVYHVHVKDVAVNLDGDAGILGSHLNFGDLRRGWDFKSPGHGQVNWDRIIRELNAGNYHGPLSVEWEDPGMDREFGAKEACEFVRRIDFVPAHGAFDAAFLTK